MIKKVVCNKLPVALDKVLLKNIHSKSTRFASVCWQIFTETGLTVHKMGRNI